MYRTIKIIVSIIIVISLINIFPIKSFSSDWIGDANNFINAGTGEVGVDQTTLKVASNDIYNMLSSIGMVISVVVGIVLGIIYMMSSAVDKAKVKESLMPYLIGSFVIFGAFGIWKIFINTLDVM